MNLIDNMDEIIERNRDDARNMGLRDGITIGLLMSVVIYAVIGFFIWG